MKEHKQLKNSFDYVVQFVHGYDRTSLIKRQSVFDKNQEEFDFDSQPMDPAQLPILRPRPHLHRIVYNQFFCHEFCGRCQ
jgi:hypothetical protein